MAAGTAPWSIEKPTAILVLADGTVIEGKGAGATGERVAEVVFNTALTGYQEILTDPSYVGQIVTFTFPHIGNIGANDDDIEDLTPAGRHGAVGAIFKADITAPSNYRSAGHLNEWLAKRGIVAISGLDTRALTALIRERGAQNAVIAHDPSGNFDLDALKAKAASWSGLLDLDLAKDVSSGQSSVWSETPWVWNEGHGAQGEPAMHIVAIDYGVKRNILRMLAERGCKVTVLPAQASAADALALNPDGIFLANGPGDPEPCDYAIKASRELIEKGIPTFGICLGHQIMALASGAKTMKMKFGHHGANHPVQDLDSKKVLITSQNHGFAVDPETLPANCRVTHVSLFDGSLQGFERTDKPAFCFQGHPEASPGPTDVAYLFDRFIGLMQAAEKN